MVFFVCSRVGLTLISAVVFFCASFSSGLLAEQPIVTFRGKTSNLSTPNQPGSAPTLARLIAKCHRSGVSREATVKLGNSLHFPIRFAGESLPDRYGLRTFSEVSPVFRLPLADGSQSHLRTGLGAPLSCVRENRASTFQETLFPPEAVTFPVTAIAEWEGTPLNSALHVQLLCPLSHENAFIDGSSQPLAADFSTSWEILAERAEPLHRNRITEVMKARPSRTPKLYLMQPYHSDKEPLILIHGLIDTPLTWLDLSQQLWSDSVIRQQYQIWHYSYDTSAPALYAGRILQKQLREIRRKLDPSGGHDAMQSTTIIAHSMGGLVTRRLISRPGDKFWNRAFHRPIEKLDLTAEERDTLREAFFWEPETHIKRVIFIAVPHRGSDFADNPIGKLGRALVRPPREFSDFYRTISSKNPGAFTADYQHLANGELDSVHALSPRQPTLQILAELPLSHPVAVHSIIGDKGRPDPPEKRSDGIVPYWSSHLDFAISEKVIRANHGVFRAPEGAEEVLRILKSEKKFCEP